MSTENKTYNCNEVISTCKYGCAVSGNQYYCNYILMEKHSRGCNAKKCDKYVCKNKGNKREPDKAAYYSI